MSKKKGLSFEEKRKKLCELFYERKDFFQLKDLEKIAPKEKGIILQSVKEVLMSLVSDGIVFSEKIGTSNYYWSFPSQALKVRQETIEKLKREIQITKEKIEKTLNQIEVLKLDRKESEKRENFEKKFEILNNERSLLNQRYQKLKNLDPDLYNENLETLKKYINATNVWTDNIFSLMSYFEKNFSVDSNQFKDIFGLDPELDYLEIETI